MLNKFQGNALLKTSQGSIKVNAQIHVSGQAFSKNGKVMNSLPLKGKYFIEAESIDGNISLFQTK
jgi:DUF4097 and DUF4098 domain-containing protein YvlB